MPTADFTAWESPDLVLTLRGRTYTVCPPSVDQAGQILACTVRAEHALGLRKGDISADMQAILDRLADVPLGVISFGQDVYDQMVADKVPAVDLDRAAYWAMILWSRGRERADIIADALWGRQDDAGATSGEEPGESPAPPPRSRSGRRTG